MGLFGAEKEKIDSESNTKEVESVISITERPRICCLDLKDDTISALEKSGANLYNGTLGAKIKVPNSIRRENHELLLHYDFPLNLHEYDIIIIDLDGYKTIDYKPEDHHKETHTGKSSSRLLSSFPETLFDPRPLSSYLLRIELNKISNRKYLVLAFSSEAYYIEYETVRTTEGRSERQGIVKYNIYSFWDHVPFSEIKYGTEITVNNKMRDDLQVLFEKYKANTTYNQTFLHPTKWVNNESIEDGKYFPLMKNMNNDIISYIEMNENENLIILPQIKEKSDFLLEFLTKVAPSIYPELFPFSTTFNWKDLKEYWLPNHSNLLSDKSNIQKEYEKKIKECDKIIDSNLTKFLFLHEIITETDDTLVKSLIKFLKWLEFDNVNDYDETNSESNILEEDIQVELSEGLLIIECKGIGGTSTDPDCSQISKIKHRRCRDRDSFDVYALYIVNHQRYLPPLKRQNPPFTENQIQDAKDDERGLLSTWQLFNLYYEIENGIISKEEARQTILEFGLIEFRPKNLNYIDEPTELFYGGEICIVNIDNISISVNDELIVEKNGKFDKVNVLDIQVNGKSVTNGSQGELGLKLSSKIRKKSTLWKKGSK